MLIYLLENSNVCCSLSAGSGGLSPGIRCLAPAGGLSDRGSGCWVIIIVLELGLELILSNCTASCQDQQKPLQILLVGLVVMQWVGSSPAQHLTRKGKVVSRSCAGPISCWAFNTTDLGCYLGSVDYDTHILGVCYDKHTFHVSYDATYLVCVL